MQEARLQGWAGSGSGDNEANIPERIRLNKQGGELTCHVCSLAGRKGWVLGAGRLLCIPRQPQGDLRGEAGGCFPWKSALAAVTSILPSDPRLPSRSIPYLWKGCTLFAQEAGRTARSFCVTCSCSSFSANALCASPLCLELGSADTEMEKVQARERQTRKRSLVAGEALKDSLEARP